MIKVSDYIANVLVEHGVRHIFMVTGGGAMHLNNSFGKNKNLTCIFNHHEQACAIAAEGYARASGKIGVVNVTTGPGGLNTLTGVMGQWTDSVPVLYISGQVKFVTTLGSCPNLKLRQLGDQEVDIISVVRPITKFAVSLRDPRDVKRVIDQAIYEACHGRPGPVWIDIPMNVQGAYINQKDLPNFNRYSKTMFNKNKVKSRIKQIIRMIKEAKRPVFIAGHGIRIANAQGLFIKLAKSLRIPVLATFNGFDLIPSDSCLFAGRIGTLGDRAGNFALQNSDLTIFLGTRNNVRQIGYNWDSFVRAARTIAVDIDSTELKKPTFTPDIPVHADVKYFLEELSKAAVGERFPNWDYWLNWCIARKDKYPVVLPAYKESRKINPYYFIEIFSKLIKSENILVAGNGTACVALYQAGIVKKGQRIFWNSGCASMGYDLPAAIGACIGNGKKDTLCLTGDGSIQMNIQELQTIVYNKLPIKIFLLNNNGYISIRQTQENFFGLPYVGCGKESGISFPDIAKLSRAYGIKSQTITKQKNMEATIRSILRYKGPFLCEIVLDPSHRFIPKSASEKKPNGEIISKPLEDMFPFLNRDEFRGNMLIPLWPE